MGYPTQNDYFKNEPLVSEISELKQINKLLNFIILVQISKLKTGVDPTAPAENRVMTPPTESIESSYPFITIN